MYSNNGDIYVLVTMETSSEYLQIDSYVMK